MSPRQKIPRRHLYAFSLFPLTSKILLAQCINQLEDLHLHLVSLTQTSSATMFSARKQKEPFLLYASNYKFINFTL